MSLRVVYLDQCHFSNLAKVRAGKLSSAGYAALLDVLDAPDVVCPFSMFHVFETARLHDPLLSAVSSMVGGLSRNICWRFFGDVNVDEATKALAPGFPAAAVGQGLDAFPRAAIDPMTRDAFHALYDQAATFAEIVKLATDPSIRSQAEFFSKTMFENETVRVQRAAEERLTLQQVRSREAETMLRAVLPEVVHPVAARLRLHPDDVFKALRARGVSAFYTAGTHIEILSRHVCKLNRRPRPSDGNDFGHMLYFAHADYVLTEIYDAEIAGGAVDYYQLPVKIFSKPEDLADALRESTPQ